MPAKKRRANRIEPKPRSSSTDAKAIRHLIATNRGLTVAQFRRRNYTTLADWIGLAK